ncbi:MAG: lipoyl(octanoyl) transferase LipB [Deltaproteobacteria bacterium]
MVEGGSTRCGSAQKCHVAILGLVGVPEADRFMSAAKELRLSGEIPDLLLFLAHPRTVALGARDRFSEHPKDLLVPLSRLEEEGIALARSVRGGGITYHWPGQIVCYPLLALAPPERHIPAYMQNLEEVGIRTLRCFGVDADRRRDTAAHLGLWRDGHKVVSMGVRVSNWVTSFGFAVNLDGNHGPSTYIRPCGINGVRLTTLERILGQAPPRPWVIDALKGNFASVVGRELEDAPASLLGRIWSHAQAANQAMTGSG